MYKKETDLRKQAHKAEYTRNASPLAKIMTNVSKPSFSRSGIGPSMSLARHVGLM